MAPNEARDPILSPEENAPQGNAGDSSTGFKIPKLVRLGALMGVLAGPTAAFGQETAIIGNGYGTSSASLAHVDLSSGTRTTLETHGSGEGNIDCEYISDEDAVICSEINSGDDGFRVITDPLGTYGTPTDTAVTDSTWDEPFKINLDRDNGLMFFGTFNDDAIVCDTASVISGSASCDVYPGTSGSAPAAVDGDLYDATEPYIVTADNLTGTVSIIRVSDGAIMYSEYAAPTHATPGLTYPYDLALDRNNDIAFIASDNTISVLEINTLDLASSTLTEAASTAAAPYELELYNNPTSGDLELAVAEGGSSSSYIEIYYAGTGASTTLLDTISTRYLGDYSPLSINEDGTIIYAANQKSATETLTAYETATYTEYDTWNAGSSTGPLAIAWPVTATPTYTHYRDGDGDGFGDPDDTIESEDSSAPSGYTTDNTDCDDGDPDTFPGAAFNDSATDCMTDADSDGFGDSAASGDVVAGTDCDDGDNTAFPGATEVCDGDLEDCDLPSADDGATNQYYRDADGDNYGTGSPVEACAPEGLNTATVDGDCDDANNSAYPGAPEAACVLDETDAVDLNCDTIEPEVCEDDEDLDGDGEISTEQGGTDCDDDDPDVNSAATEDCADGIDNDCDNLTDLLDTEDCETTVVTDDGDCILEENEVVTISEVDPRCTTLFLDNETSGNSIADPVGTFAWVDYATVSLESLEASGIVIRDDAVSDATIEVVMMGGEAFAVSACQIGFEMDAEGWTAWTIDLNDAAEHWFDLQLPTLNGGEWIERAAMEGEQVVIEADGTINEEETTGEGACAVEGVDCEAEENPVDTGEIQDDTGNPNNPDTGRTEQPDDGCNGCATAGGIEGATGYFGTKMALLLALGAGLLRRRKE